MNINSKLSPLAIAIALASTHQAYANECDEAATELVVTTVADSINPNDDKISLREAINQVAENCDGSEDVITFHEDLAGQTIQIDTAEAGKLTVDKSAAVKIQGPESNPITLSRNIAATELLRVSSASLTLENLILDGEKKASATRMLYINSATANLNNITIKNSNVSSSTSAIQLVESSTLNIKGGTYRDNDGYTGGVLKAEHQSQVSIIDAEFNDNNASYGGAIHSQNAKSINIQGSQFNNNQAQHNGYGGAIILESSDTIVISDSIFDGNMSDGESGALHIRNNGGTVDYSIEDTEFKNNSANYSGGAVQYFHNSESGSSITIKRSQFVNNEADKANESHKGGALYLAGHYANLDVLVEDSSFSENKAEYGPAIAANADSIDIEVNIKNSTLNANEGGYGAGAVWMRAQESGNIELAIENSTLSNNSADGYGGAISLWNAHDNSGLEIIHSTIVNNTAQYGGGLHAFSANELPTISVKNSIIGGNSATNTDQTIGQDVLTDSGLISFENSVIGDAGGEASSRNKWENENNSSQVGNDGITAAVIDVMAMIGPLQDNGGPTLTHSPLDADALVDQGGTLETPLSTDQRGANRDTQPDIGAVENSSSSLVWTTFTAIDNQEFEIDQDISIDLNDYIADSDQHKLSYSSDNLPQGISLSEGGLLSGSFSTAGSYALVFTVTDQFGGRSQSPQLNIDAVEAPSSKNSDDGILGGALTWLWSLSLLLLTRGRRK